MPTTFEDKSSKVPSLKSLAANVIQKTNPNLFFRLHSLETPPEIKKGFIDKELEALTRELTEDYQTKVEARNEKIEECSSNLSSNECFVKCSAFTLTTLMAGVHVGIYYILKAAAVDPSTQIAYISSIPATICFSMCVGVCLNRQITKCLSSCFTPSVPDKITVDLDELGRQPHVSP
ncbi:TPA: lpg2692 family Dot/Icm T4SS effector [Legionella pneumophila]|nr:lpg2692 family Dot/Icm T4SS effector [Legionella pneumophila]